MPSNTATNQIRVLLIEDNATDALLVSDELEHAAAVLCVLTQSQRLAEAITRLAEQPFDVVLLDLTLPDSDGMETYTALQAAAPDMPIVVLSHLADEAIALQAVRAGAQDYLVKGLSAGLLLRAIRHAIDRNEAKVNLRMSEARWTAALEGAGDGVWDWNIAAKTVFFSRRWKEMLGYADQEVDSTPDSWSQRVHPDDMAQVQVNLRAHLDGISPKYHCEHRLLRKDGSYVWVLGRGMVVKRDALGKALRIVGTNTDISARRKADQQLHLLEASLAHIDDAVIITSADRTDAPYPRIVYVNAAFVWRTGYSRAEAIGNTPAMLQGLNTQRGELDRIAEALRHWQPVQAELINYTKSGDAFWLEIVISPLKDSKGWVTHWVAVQRDISERQKASWQMQSTLEALKASQAQLQTLSRRILNAQETERRRVALELHDELGQSLTAIKINLQLSARFKERSPADLNDENLRIVEDALQQVRRLALALRPSVLDDLGLVPALRGIAEDTAGRSGFAIHFHPVLPKGRLAPEVETACFRIVQEALTNVARYAEARRVDIDLFLDGDELLLSVKDDGVGFDVAAMQARASAGSSMGVLGMRERAMLIGGRLEIASARDHGCTVSLRCPMLLPIESR
jgi:PAS domain S-box-containing protein